MKERTIIYLLITGIIAIICGGGFVWYANQFEPEIPTIKITNQRPQVLGEETEQVDIQEQIDQEPLEEKIIIEESQPTTQPVIKTGMSSSEVNGLFLTYYKREAEQDEFNWWTGRDKTELEATLKNNPIVTEQPKVEQPQKNKHKYCTSS